MTKRFEEFNRDGKNIIYIDLSELRCNDEFVAVTKGIQEAIAKHSPGSLYTITNIENVRYDSASKKIITAYLEHNKPYVKHGIIIGLDGIKKMMLATLFKISGRKNLTFAYSKENAIEMILKQY